MKGAINHRLHPFSPAKSPKTENILETRFLTNVGLGAKGKRLSKTETRSARKPPAKRYSEPACFGQARLGTKP
jgi:hypothetical protein